ncbi:MAG TPA: SDR family oxidoreductase [Candidatus Binatia bacterium]|nr:SDR family oxidoreductase [Candidatus Binatia bacterium]
MAAAAYTRAVMNTSHRTAIVTGGGGGIGRAISIALAGRDLQVVVADVDDARAAAVADEVGGLPVQLDVADSNSLRAALALAHDRLGPIDVLVNCAGWDEARPFLETDDAFSAKVVEINLMGPIRVCRAVLPDMLTRAWGRIINIASDAGRVGSSNESIYSAAKGGLIAITKTLAREYATRGITVNAVSPGPTDTPLFSALAAAGGDSSKTMAALERAVPMRRLGRPADVAGAVAFLASDEASYITGQTLSVNGGLAML